MGIVRGMLCSTALMVVAVAPVFGQTSVPTAASEVRSIDRFSTSSWCEDALTLCFSGRHGRAFFSGLRLVFEPNLGVIFQNGENRFQNTSFKALERVGLETNIRQGYIAIQGLLIYPSTVEFDEKSPIVGYIRDGTGRVGVDYGLSFGLSFLDGILASGVGYLNYDQRDLVEADGNGNRQPRRLTTDVYFYFNVQPIAAVRSALRN